MMLRAPVPDDAPAVLAVLAERDMIDLGAPDYTLEDLREEWEVSEFDLSRDAVVAETDDGRIVGYAALRRPGAWGVVAPMHEGRGIGARLLRWAEQRDRERGRTQHRQWVAASCERGVVLLRENGYEHVRSYWRMVRELDGSESPGAPPAGVILRPPALEREAAALYALDDLSFSANPDYDPHTFEQFFEEHVHAHDLDASLCRVAVQDETIVGYLLTRRWEHDRAGFVDVLAVHPEAQRRGIGSALLHDAFAACAAAGLHEAQLGVASDNPRALQLYERSGMRPRFRIDTYERPVSMTRP